MVFFEEQVESVKQLLFRDVPMEQLANEHNVLSVLCTSTPPDRLPLADTRAGRWQRTFMMSQRLFLLVIFEPTRMTPSLGCSFWLQMPPMRSDRGGAWNGNVFNMMEVSCAGYARKLLEVVYNDIMDHYLSPGIETWRRERSSSLISLYRDQGVWQSEEEGFQANSRLIRDPAYLQPRTLPAPDLIPNSNDANMSWIDDLSDDAYYEDDGSPW